MNTGIVSKVGAHMGFSKGIDTFLNWTVCAQCLKYSFAWEALQCNCLAWLTDSQMYKETRQHICLTGASTGDGNNVKLISPQ